MKLKKAVVLILLLCLPVAYCALPLTSVSTITLTLEDEQGGKVAGRARAVFLDADGKEIVAVALGALPSWDNNIHWWAHSSEESSLLRPDDARRVRGVRVEADGCVPLTLPMQVAGSYVPPSIAPHGGGRAYMLYEFTRTLRLDCAAP